MKCYAHPDIDRLGHHYHHLSRQMATCYYQHDRKLVSFSYAYSLYTLPIQELIQNAEDARATQVKFLYDKNSYGTTHLYDEDLAQFQVQLNVCFAILV